MKTLRRKLGLLFQSYLFTWKVSFQNSFDLCHLTLPHSLHTFLFPTHPESLSLDIISSRESYLINRLRKVVLLCGPIVSTVFVVTI